MRSALNELEAASRLLATILLRFLHARIAGKETASAKLLAQAIVVLEQRASDAELDRARLSCDAAAVSARLHIEPAVHREMHERTSNEDLKHRSAQILFKVSAIDADVSLAGSQPDSGDRVLAATGSVVPAR